MDVEIKKQPKTSITEDIDCVIKLEPLTIFAGNNNSGKTHLINAIGKKLSENDINVVHIPSERILVENELKTGAEKDPLRAALGDLIEFAFDADSSISSDVSDISVILPAEFIQYGIENIDISVKTNTLTNDEYKKALKDAHIKKLIDSIVISDKYCGVEDISPSNVGQGTQRMIVVSLIRYLQRKKFEKDGRTSKPTYIIFEEPEIYLHPKMKATLYALIQAIANDGRLNTKVILTTHDPYFIDMGRNAKIYRVFRDPLKNFSTQLMDVQKDVLLYPSSAEINYIVFEQVSPTYLLELYESKKQETELKLGKKLGGLKYYEFDLALFNKIGEPQSSTDDDGHPVTFITRIRHDMAHPSTSILDSFESRGKEAIEKLRNYKA
ncbi:MAG: AAA family ATPase [bacterium]|nr:AAA family ATPase [bacterium]